MLSNNLVQCRFMFSNHGCRIFLVGFEITIIEFIFYDTNLVRSFQLMFSTVLNIADDNSFFKFV